MTIHLRSGDRILDIGCGTGEYLDSQRELGLEAYGVEINPDASRYACEIRGLNVFTGFLEEADYSAEYFDGVYMSQVLEHLPDPTRTLAEIHRILKKCGSLTISVPASDSLDARLFKKNWLGWRDTPRHYYHFSSRTIKLLLDKTGFEIVRIKHDTHPGGILASFLFYLDDRGISTPAKYVCYFCFYPFGYTIGIIVGLLGLSGSIAVYARKKNVDLAV